MESETKTVKAVADYVAEIAKKAKTGITTEHSFRAALAALLDALAPGLQAVNEPNPTFHVQTSLRLFSRG